VVGGFIPALIGVLRVTLKSEVVVGRPRAACGTYAAYQRHLRFGEVVDEACRRAQVVRDQRDSSSVAARLARAAAAKTETVVPVQVAVEEEASDFDRLVELRVLLDLSSAGLRSLAAHQPDKLHLLLREHREIVREITVLEGTAVEGSLSDELAAARSRRESAAQGSQVS